MYRGTRPEHPRPFVLFWGLSETSQQHSHHYLPTNAHLVCWYWRNTERYISHISELDTLSYTTTIENWTARNENQIITNPLFDMKVTFLGNEDTGMRWAPPSRSETPNKTNLPRATSYNWDSPHHSFYSEVFPNNYIPVITFPEIFIPHAWIPTSQTEKRTAATLVARRYFTSSCPTQSLSIYFSFTAMLLFFHHEDDISGVWWYGNFFWSH